MHEPQDTALAVLSLLAGAVSVARATRSAPASDAAARAARAGALSLLRARGLAM